MATLGNFIITVWLLIALVVTGAAVLKLRGPSRLVSVTACLLFFIALPTAWLFQKTLEYDTVKATKARHYAHLQERCKSAGYFIYRKITGVTGIELLKVRDDDSPDHTQFSRKDPYGRDGAGDYYIGYFLKSYMKGTSPGMRLDGFAGDVPVENGFDFVDVPQPDGTRVRYTGTYAQVGLPGANSRRSYEFKLSSAPTTAPRAEYGITYDDISTDKDLQLWIAGSSLKIIDLRSGKLVAERIGYMLDPGMGQSFQAWERGALAACPSFGPTSLEAFRHRKGQTRRFADLVLRGIDHPTNN
jgi:hypothetical protein